MAQSRVRQALTSLTALRRSLPPKPSISSSLSSQQQHTCSFLTCIVQSRACTTFPTVYENKGMIDWVLVMRFEDPKPTREEIISTYEETCSKVLHISLEEAKQRIYVCDTTIGRYFGAKMTKEESEKFNGVPGVVYVFPDVFRKRKYQKYEGNFRDNRQGFNSEALEELESQGRQQLENEAQEEYDLWVADHLQKG